MQCEAMFRKTHMGKPLLSFLALRIREIGFLFLPMQGGGMECFMNGSKEIMAAAIRLAVTSSMEEEKLLARTLREQGVSAAAVNFGGEYISSVGKIIERTIVAAKREGVITEAHNEEGAVAGAAHEAVIQIDSKALGLNIGGKIGIARQDEHICVAMYFGVGLVHLNEIAIGIGHRVI